jgi:hypothetical protein
MTSEYKYGFRIVGSCHNERRLVDHGKAFAAYCRCDPKANGESEAYLSAFQFAADFAEHLNATGSTAGFAGSTWAPWLWFDLDAPDDPSHAQQDAAGLVEWLAENARVDLDGLLVFFSGAKGFHVGLPTALWAPSPGVDFHRTARRFAEAVADAAAVTIDTGVYDRVRAFRAPNSKHPKTGRHKRRLTFDDLSGPIGSILDLAANPAPFDLPSPPVDRNDRLADLWRHAVDLVATEREAKAQRRTAGNGTPTLNKQTLLFIRDGAGPGDRHRLLFSAAANLAEFGCPHSLATALLREPALDSGLPPKEVDRQIQCGLDAAGSVPLDDSSPLVARSDDPDGLNDSKPVGPENAATSDPTDDTGDTCGSLQGAPEKPAADLSGALAALWGSSPVATSTAATATLDDPTPPGARSDDPDGLNDSKPVGPENAATSDSGDDTGDNCGSLQGAPEKPAADVQAALASLWSAPSPAPAGRSDDPSPVPTSTPAARTAPLDDPSPSASPPAPVPLPPDPPPLKPVPPRTVATGVLDPPCKRCGSTAYVEIAISEDRTRIDCRNCNKFQRFGTWHTNERGSA